MEMENCVVCLVQFSQNDISLAKFTDEDSRNRRRKVSCVYRKILRIFCKYFNLPCKQKENDGEIQEENGILSSFPFCIECRNLVAELCIFHEKSESIHKIIQNTVAKITLKIVQTENDKENCSNSDPLENGDNGQKMRNKMKHEYRRQILQNFNPRVLLTDCQSQNPNQEKFSSETNLTTTNLEDESLLNYDDSHGNSNDNDVMNGNDGDQNYSNAQISVNSSDHSQETEKHKEKNSSMNLTSTSFDENSARKETTQNLMQQIRAQFNTAPQDFPPLENSIQKKIQPSDSTQRRSKKNSLALEDKMSSPNIENLGDGKYLYKNAWPFHIIENQEVFSCDTCQRQLPFCKRRNQKFYKGIVQHIRLQHNSTADNNSTSKVAKRDSAENPGSFRFRGKWNFEKVELGFQCGHCPIIYTQFKSMQNHLEIWHVPGKFKCSKCPQSCRTRGLLNQHRCRWNLQTTNRSFEIRPGSGKFVYSGDLIG